MAENANTIWADGPSGAPSQPNKAEVREWGTDLEQNMAATLAVANGNLVFPTKTDAQVAAIPSAFHGVSLRGGATIGDGLGGDYIDTNNGSTDTFVSAGVTARTWYRVADVGEVRLAAAVKAKLNGPNSPISFNAVGDGVADDATAYAAAEAASSEIYLNPGKTFNLAAAFPARPVYGPGSLKMGAKTIKGLEPMTFVQRGSVYFNPSDQGINGWLYTQFPADGQDGHANTVFGVGALDGKVGANGESLSRSRIASFGANNLQAVVQANRIDAFGSSVMRWMKYGERNSGIGSLAFQWAGGNLTEDPEGKFYYHDIIYNAGVPITDPAWNANGFETANPGIRATLAALVAGNPWATATTDFMRNTGVGRDAGVDLIKGTYNTFMGYRAGAWAFIQDWNTSVGADAGNNNMLGSGNANFGFEAGFANQSGNNNTALGRQAVHDFVTNSFNTGVGFRAGYTAKGGDGNLYLGPYSGGHDVVDPHSRRFYVGQSALLADQHGLIVGDFATGKIGFGLDVKFADLSNVGGMLVRINGGAGGVAPNVSAGGFVLEDGLNNTGITIKTLNSKTSFLVFADPDDNNPGLISYNHATDVMTLRAGDTDRLTIGTAANFTVPIQRGGNQVVDTRKTGWAVATGTATRTTFATSTVTLPQLAERVKALIDDLHATAGHGLIGT